MALLGTEQNGALVPWEMQHSGERHLRTEVLPVQWRKNLDLDVDEVAAKIMPKNIEGIRSLSHQTAVR